MTITAKIDQAFFDAMLGENIAQSPRSKLPTLMSHLRSWIEWAGMGRDEAALFLGACAVESDRFRAVEEYADGTAYEGRASLGNTESGDGPRYKGRGIIQCTGRKNYSALAAWLKDMGAEGAVVEDPGLLADEGYYSVASAVWYWTSYQAEDTQRTCQGVARDVSLSLSERCKRGNAIIYRGVEITGKEISLLDLRQSYTQAAWDALG